jgi:TolA-binding protein
MNRILMILVVGLFSLSCGVDKSAEDLFSQAEALRKSKDIKGSMDQLQLLIKTYPNHALAAKSQYMLGDIYMNDLRDFQQAIQAYQQVVNQYAGSDQEAQAQFMIGYIYANILANYDLAAQSYRTFLDKFPDHELAPSVRFELEYLGKDINDIPVLKQITSQADPLGDRDFRTPLASLS